MKLVTNVWFLLMDALLEKTDQCHCPEFWGTGLGCCSGNAVVVWSSDWAPGGRAGPTKESSGASNSPEWPEGVKPGSTPSQTSFKGWQWRARVSWWRSLPTWGLLRVSRFFFSFVSMSLAAAFGFILPCGSLGLCYPTIIAVLSVASWHYRSMMLFWEWSWDMRHLSERLDCSEITIKSSNFTVHSGSQPEEKFLLNLA